MNPHIDGDEELMRIMRAIGTRLDLAEEQLPERLLAVGVLVQDDDDEDDLDDEDDDGEDEDDERDDGYPPGWSD